MLAGGQKKLFTRGLEDSEETIDKTKKHKKAFGLTVCSESLKPFASFPIAPVN